MTTPPKTPDSIVAALPRVAGWDLGKATARLVVARVHPDGQLTVESSRSRAHEGRPLDVFREWYRADSLGDCAALAATGTYARDLIRPALAGVPEEACFEAALGRIDTPAGPLNVVRVGARGYSVLSRDEQGRVRHVENEKCSAGTGETMVKIAARFGLSVEEADALAMGASESIPVTARCSVFAKSEMTHFGNQGKPKDALFRGYFESVARNVAALLERTRVPGPVWLVGGGGRLRALSRALADQLGAAVETPDGALLWEALGAAVIAAEHARAGGLAPLPAAPLPDDPERLVRPAQRRFRTLEPARRWADRVTRLERAPTPPAGAGEPLAGEPTVLGLDLGSTGSKAVLTSVATGEPLLDVYDKTRGNPVDAMQRLLRAVLAAGRADVRAVCVTGSGREAAATVLRAVFPAAGDRVHVANEIVAHAAAAIRCDDRGGESLSIIEIGGQDAKFIQVVQGQIVASDMNRACSAGTGSFLEEQAFFHGVHDIQEFVRLAGDAERPPDLGQMCTVFVAEAAEQALAEGFGVEDLFAGFQYSVIHNYIHRVMGPRTLGERVFFQGKPASNPSLAWTLAAVTGRDVVVPPNPGAMGAWGIGLLAREALGVAALAAAAPLDAAAVLAAEVVAQGELRCRDRDCQTMCVIDKTTVAVDGATRTVLSGGACPKYEDVGAARTRLPRTAPDAFAERAALLAPFLADGPGERVIGVPLVGVITGLLPWLTTFLRELGLGVRVFQPDAGALARGETRTFAYDACAPVKVAHGVADAAEGVDALLLPKILDLPDREGPGGATCPMEQGLPELVERSLAAGGRSTPVLRPVLNPRAGLTSRPLLRQLRQFAGGLGVGARRALGAARRAAVAQRAYDRDLAAVGRRSLEYGRAQGVPAVVVCGALHVLHDPIVSSGVPALLRRNGVLAVPMDAFPVPDGVHALPRVVWADASRALRVALAARAQGGVFPLLLTSFGCGPTSFVEQIFSSLMEGYPHTVLESDGHGGAAGYVTRVQAFLHTVREVGHEAAPVPADRLRALEPLPMPSIRDERDARLVVMPLADRFGPLMAAFYRSLGYDAVATAPASAEGLELARRDCSGKECLPYQLIWGTYRKHLQDHPPDRRTVLVQVTGSGMCRNCMFSVKDQLALAGRPERDRVALRHLRPEPEVRVRFVTRLWASVVVWDILQQLVAYYRPTEREPGAADALYERLCVQLEAHLERPVRRGPFGWRGRARWWSALLSTLDEAAEGFAAVGNGAPAASGNGSAGNGRAGNGRAGNGALPVVLVTGDIYLRLDDFASDRLVRRLNRRGVRAIPEPMSGLVEYMAAERSAELVGLPTDRLQNAALRVVLPAIRKPLYARVRRLHPWLPQPDAQAMRRAAFALLDRHPIGEAPITLGSVLEAWGNGACDGVVVVGPWGCGPSLIAEGLLRHERDIPSLFLYADGSPIDGRRLDAFAFRLGAKGAFGDAALD